MTTGKHVNKPTKNSILFSYILIVLVLLAHIGIAAFIILTSRYYAVDFKTILTAVAFLLVIFVILDIIFFVSIRYNDNILKTIATIMASILLVASAVTSFYVYQINNSIDKIIDDGDEQFETISGTFVSYKNVFNDLKAIDGKKVGVLYETNEGTGSIGQEELTKSNVNSTIVQFNTMDDLLFGLIEEEVDAAVFPSSYRQRYSNDDEVDFDRYLDDLHDFYTFEKQVKTGENQGKKIDLSTQPFNILLIGFAPETADNSYGLSDAIIIATVNPQTLKVSLTSIARDSYVPISCYYGSKDKINSARGNSRQCLIDTVNDLMGTDISLYMEVNFQGVVDIVDALGGVMIDNPVTFVGQTPSATRGEMRVLVPAGQYVATGEQALAFARERHHMPRGDFDRQQHQQEVISAMARKLIELRDVNAALKVMEAAGNNISTNLSITQLTGIFNYILNVKNYTGFKTSDIITIDNMRVTGYASWTYNYSLRLPLWIYKLYNGSIKEAKDHINLVLGNVDLAKAESEQEPYHRFFVNYPYYRETLYSETFDEPQEHEKMPDFVPLLTGKSYSEAVTWANSMGVSLSVSTIEEGDPRFDASLSGQVLDQNPRQGALVMENPVVYLEVMGYEKVEITIDCTTYEEAIALAEKYGLKTQVKFVANDGTHEAWELSYTEPQYGTVFEEGTYDTLYICVYGCPGEQEMMEDGTCHLHSWSEWGYANETDKCNTEYYGTQVRTCSSCGKTETRRVDAAHDFQPTGNIIQPTATEWGGTEVKCTRCGAVELRDPIAPTGETGGGETPPEGGENTGG